MKLDYIFVNTPADSEKSLKLHELLQSYGFTGYVLDTTTETVDEACEKVFHVLVCVSNNISNDTFLALKSQVLQNWFKGRPFHLIPVYLQPKRDLNDDVYSYSYGITSFNGFHVCSRYFEEDVRKQFTSTRKIYQLWWPASHQQSYHCWIQSHSVYTANSSAVQVDVFRTCMVSQHARWCFQVCVHKFYVQSSLPNRAWLEKASV